MTSDLPAFLGGEKAFPAGPSLPRHDMGIFHALESSWNDSSWASYDSGHVLGLEKSIAELFVSPHVLTCTSGTLGVEVALKSLGIKPGDLVDSIWSWSDNSDNIRRSHIEILWWQDKTFSTICRGLIDQDRIK